MLKKLTEGLALGCGFGISFFALWFIAAQLISPRFVETQIGQVANKHSPVSDAIPKPSITPSPETRSESGPPFHELKIEEQIKKSSAIAIARYEQAPDGKMKAIIKEFLKKDPDVTIYYKVGDEHVSSSHYPKEGTSYGDGLVIFFGGSPATMTMSMSFQGDRILGLGDLPLELLKKKCKEPNA